MDEHNILRALIEGDYGDTDRPAAEEVEEK